MLDAAASQMIAHDARRSNVSTKPAIACMPPRSSPIQTPTCERRPTTSRRHEQSDRQAKPSRPARRRKQKRQDAGQQRPARQDRPAADVDLHRLAGALRFFQRPRVFGFLLALRAASFPTRDGTIGRPLAGVGGRIELGRLRDRAPAPTALAPASAAAARCASCRNRDTRFAGRPAISWRASACRTCGTERRCTSAGPQ